MEEDEDIRNAREKLKNLLNPEWQVQQSVGGLVRTFQDVVNVIRVWEQFRHFRAGEEDRLLHALGFIDEEHKAALGSWVFSVYDLENPKKPNTETFIYNP